MSYCRFENTASDLQDVLDNWNSLDELSSTHEYGARKEIWEMAREIAEFSEPKLKEEME